MPMPAPQGMPPASQPDPRAVLAQMMRQQTGAAITPQEAQFMLPPQAAPPGASPTGAAITAQEAAQLPAPASPPGQEGSLSGMVPDWLEGLWGVIPSAADMAVTGKPFASPQEYDRMRALKEAQMGRPQGQFALPR